MSELETLFIFRSEVIESVSFIQHLLYTQDVKETGSGIVLAIIDFTSMGKESRYTINCNKIDKGGGYGIGHKRNQTALRVSDIFLRTVVGS